MSDALMEAFIQAYSDNVGNHSDERVREFCIAFRKSNSGEAARNLYADFNDCYTSVMDALGMFQSGMAFATS